MSDDWKVGDLALCVDARTPEFCPTEHRLSLVEFGKIYEVTAVIPSEARPFFALLLDGEAPYTCDCCVGENGWDPARFRKIRADEHEDCEPEFVELLNRIKRKVSA